MKKSQWAAALLLAAVLLSGCGSTASDYQNYIQGSYDVIYKGEFKDYMETTGATEVESKKQYEASVSQYAVNFANKLGIDLEMSGARMRMERIVKNLLKLANYKVAPAKKKDDTYYVEVTVRPMIYIDGVLEQAETRKKELERKMEQQGFATEKEYKGEYQESVFDIMEEALDYVAYEEDEEVFPIPIRVKGSVYKADHEDLVEVTDYIFQITK